MDVIYDVVLSGVRKRNLVAARKPSEDGAPLAARSFVYDRHLGEANICLFARLPEERRRLFRF